METIGKAFLLVVLMGLAYFYYVFFRVTLSARRRMAPWLRALKGASQHGR